MRRRSLDFSNPALSQDPHFIDTGFVLKLKKPNGTRPSPNNSDIRVIHIKTNEARLLPLIQGKNRSFEFLNLMSLRKPQRVRPAIQPGDFCIKGDPYMFNGRLQSGQVPLRRSNNEVNKPHREGNKSFKGSNQPQKERTQPIIKTSKEPTTIQAQIKDTTGTQPIEPSGPFVSSKKKGLPQINSKRGSRNRKSQEKPKKAKRQPPLKAQQEIEAERKESEPEFKWKIVQSEA